MPPSELADRLAIADLVNAYAQRVDHHDAAGVAALFTTDGTLSIHGDVGVVAPTSVCHGRAEIERTIAAMAYRTTCHLIGNHLAAIDRDEATGETRCVAHHVSGSPGTEVDRVWYLRYEDRFARCDDGRWRIAERVLRLDIVERRSLAQVQAGTAPAGGGSPLPGSPLPGSPLPGR
ncbi:MAG TPA: nuclear transport factor 2 family protein [Acidimicrobiales bacterium]|nr:nuclear transport factor 2 family protein [Acidimicrobiales bacterium]